MRERPAWVFGPVDFPPWKRQRALPGSALTWQPPPARPALTPVWRRVGGYQRHVPDLPIRPHDARAASWLREASALATDRAIKIRVSLAADFVGTKLGG